jgi:inosose dehydratase
MMQRREFLTTLAAAPAAMGAGGYEPVLAAQAYIFSQAYARLNQRMEDRISEVLEILSTSGYKTLELTSQFFTADNASNTAQALMLGRLKCPVVYNGGVMHTAEEARKTIQQTLDLAKRVKAAHPITGLNFNANPKPQGEAKTDAELAVQAENLNKLAKELKKQNVRLMIHQHAPEMANNAREWRHILANTDPKLVDICLDVHWVLRGGQDPMALLKECSTRLASLHLRNSKNGVWTEDFGDGDIDYRPIAEHLKSIGYKGYLVVELAWDKATEPTRSLDENMKRSREYAEKIFGVKA